jgi:CMP-N-acetylneuraminic acid synthetase
MVEKHRRSERRLINFNNVGRVDLLPSGRVNMQDECWAVIPARGGSKGVKGKNSKILGNLPLICHTIEALQFADCFDKIIVTSDSEKILQVSKDAGAEVHFRTDCEESNDIVMPDVPAISCIKSFPKEQRPVFSFMVQCTSPFIKAASYKNAYQKLVSHPSSTVFAAYTSHDFLWEKKFENLEDSPWVPINHPFHERVGRQFSKSQQVNETGAFYGFSTEGFLSNNHRFFSDAFPVIISDDELLDINSQDDWKLAEYLIQQRSM